MEYTGLHHSLSLLELFHLQIAAKSLLASFDYPFLPIASAEGSISFRGKRQVTLAVSLLRVAAPAEELVFSSTRV